MNELLRLKKRPKKTIRFWLLPLCTLLFVFITYTQKATSAVDRSKLPETYDELDGDDLLLRLALDGRLKELRELEREVGFRRADQAPALYAKAFLQEADGQHEAALANLALAIERAVVREQRIAAAREHLRLAIQGKRPEFCDVGLAALLKSKGMSPLDHRQVSACYALKGLKGELRAVSYLDTQIEKDGALRFQPLVLAERVRLWTKLGLLHLAESELSLAISRDKPSAGGGNALSGIVMDFLEGARTQKLGRPPFGERLLAQVSHMDGVQDREALLGLEAQRMFALGQKINTVTRFEQLARLQPQETNYAIVASELFRLMGWKITANRVAMSIADSKARVKLVAAEYLEAGQMAKLAAMFPSLDRSLYGGDMSEAETQEWVYLGAFARFQSGGWLDRSSLGPMQWLRYLKSDSLREKALSLRNLVEDCRSGASKVCEL